MHRWLRAFSERCSSTSSCFPVPALVCLTEVDFQFSNLRRIWRITRSLWSWTTSRGLVSSSWPSGQLQSYWYLVYNHSCCTVKKNPIIVLGLCGCFSSCSLFFDLLLKVDPGDGKDFLLYIWTFSAQTEQITADKKFYIVNIILRLKCNHKCKRCPGAGSDARRRETRKTKWQNDQVHFQLSGC